MSTVDRIRLARRVIGRYARVRLLLARFPLPDVVEVLTERRPSLNTPIEVMRLRRAVERLLVLPGRPLKCLPRALVLYSMLVEEGQDARIAIGLPQVSAGIRAHAWVEVEGIDVGPSPGRAGHAPLALYPMSSSNQTPTSPEA